MVSSRDVKLKYSLRGWTSLWLIHPLVGGPSHMSYVKLESVVDGPWHDAGVLSSSNGQSGIIFILSHQLSKTAS